MTSIQLGSGRRVAVHRVADGSADRTVVLCHPAPGSGLFDPDPDATWARGVTLIGVDRPGYGGSDPAPGGLDPSADDLAEVLDHLGTGPVGMAGWGVGGLVAFGLAARRPDLVDRLAVIGTPAPDHEIPWIPPAVRSAVADPDDQALTRLVFTDPDDWMGLLGAGDPDAAALEDPGARSRLVAMLKAAFTQGAAGLAADCRGSWDLAPARVAAKTLLLYGAQDPLAGPRHGKWWQPRLPQARYEQIPDAGHLVIMQTWRRALSHLAPHAKRR